MRKSRSKLDDDLLIQRHVGPEWLHCPGGSAEARLAESAESGVPVWALVGHFKAVGNDADRVAVDYELSREAADAALAYYRRHTSLIDARLLLNSTA